MSEPVVKITSLDTLNPTYDVEWKEQQGNKKRKTTTNVVAINGVEFETEGFKILDENKIKTIEELPRKVNIITHE